MPAKFSFSLTAWFSCRVGCQGALTEMDCQSKEPALFCRDLDGILDLWMISHVLNAAYALYCT